MLSVIDSLTVLQTTASLDFPVLCMHTADQHVVSAGMLIYIVCCQIKQLLNKL